MEHAEAIRVMPAYHQGGLDRETVRAFHTHIKTCEDCRSRIRLQGAAARGKASPSSQGLASPETQAQIARNRDMMVKILALMALAWAVWKFKQ